MKPGDFLLGLLDFFAVLLPGAVATWLIAHYLPAELQKSFDVLHAGDAVAPWILFAFSSYAVGHFVFMAGSSLDGAYDRWRKRTRPTVKDVPFKQAKLLRKQLTPMLVDEDFTVLKWSKSYLGIHSPAARLEVDRFEATSKFFRGFVVVAAAASIHFLVARQGVGLVVAAALVSVLSFWRYCDQRLKMTELAYASVVIVHETGGKKPADASRASDED
jgi:hypothetical protein